MFDRVENLSKVLAKLDSILSCKDVRVAVKVDGSVEAYVDMASGSRVNISLPAFDVVLAKALNFHELGHVLYTRFSSEEKKQLKRYKTLRISMNILEDLRISNLLINRFGGVINDYLSWLTYDTVVKSGVVSLGVYFILYGSKFLSPKFVKRYRGTVIGKTQQLRQWNEGTKEKFYELERIVDEYLVTSRSSERFMLIQKFAEIFFSVWGTGDIPVFYQGSWDEVFQAGQGSLDSDELERMERKIEQFNEQFQEDEGPQENQIPDEKEILKEAENARVIIEDDEDFQDDIRETLTAVYSPNEDWDTNEMSRQKRGRQYPVNDQMRKNSLQIRRVLKVIKGNEKKFSFASTGKVDIRRVMKARYRGYYTTPKIFRKKMISFGRGKLRVLIVLDRSGSMSSSVLWDLSQLAWEIWKACVKEGSTVRVIGFDHDVVVLEENEYSFTGVDPRGQTHFSIIHKYCAQMFMNAEKEEGKLLIILTDAEFNDMKKSIDLMKSLQKQGVVIWMGFVGSETQSKYLKHVVEASGCYAEKVEQSYAYEKTREEFMKFMKNYYKQEVAGRA